jgi:hypothetical protein
MNIKKKMQDMTPLELVWRRVEVDVLVDGFSFELPVSPLPLHSASASASGGGWGGWRVKRDYISGSNVSEGWSSGTPANSHNNTPGSPNPRRHHHMLLLDLDRISVVLKEPDARAPGGEEEQLRHAPRRRCSNSSAAGMLTYADVC